MPVSDEWGADCPTSMPTPSEIPLDATKVDLGGFVFTENGIGHDLTAVDLEVVYTPRFQPMPTGGGNY
jgi:hypothetical protein